MFSKLFISFATFSALTSVVYAQSTTPSSAASTALPTSPAQLTPCILQCTQSAATTAGCQSITDFQCLCTSQAFQTAATQCLTTQCTAADLQTALGLQKVECANITPPANSSSTASTTNSTTSAASGSSSSTPSTAAGSPTTPAAGKPNTPIASPTSPASSSGSNSNSGSSSNTTTTPPATSSTSAGFAPQFALSASHMIGLASAVAVGVVTGSTLFL